MAINFRKKAGVILALSASLAAIPAYAQMSERSAFIPAGEISDAPSGFVEMCGRDWDLCKAGHSDMGASVPVFNWTKADRKAADTIVVSRNWSLVPSLPTLPITSVSVSAAPSAWMMRAIKLKPLISLWISGYPGATLALTDIAAMPTAAIASAQDAVDIGRKADRIYGGRQADPVLKALKYTNADVNTHVRQQSDFESRGADERWERTGTGRRAVGDCEDFAIEKRMRLIEAGFDPKKLFYAIVYRGGFGLHTVLVARTEQGDLVLDSLSPHILKWTETRYSWLRIQSADNPTIWYRVGSSQQGEWAANTATPQHIS